MQLVRYELVVALQIVIGDIEKNRAIFALGARFQNTDRQLVAFGATAAMNDGATNKLYMVFCK